MTIIIQSEYCYCYVYPKIQIQFRPDWSYEELNNDGSKIADRTYSNSDIVLRWTAVYDPNAAVTEIVNSLKVSSEPLLDIRLTARLLAQEQ